MRASWVAFGGSWNILGGSLALLGGLGCLSGHLGRVLGRLGCDLAHLETVLGRSWSLEAVFGALGCNKVKQGGVRGLVGRPKSLRSYVCIGFRALLKMCKNDHSRTIFGEIRDVLGIIVGILKILRRFNYTGTLGEAPK